MNVNNTRPRDEILSEICYLEREIEDAEFVMKDAQSSIKKELGVIKELRRRITKMSAKKEALEWVTMDR